jgi:molybdopterin-biosynthesis enzyme MoeA-like protein
MYEKSLDVTEIIESALAPLIDRVMREHPTVYVKSHPKAAEPIPLIELHLSTFAPSQEEAKKQVEAAATEVTRLIEEYGGVIEPFAV